MHPEPPIRGTYRCRRWWTMLAGAVVAVGCGKSPVAPSDAAAPSDGAPLDVPGHTAGTPGLGGHAIRFYHLQENSSSSIALAAMTTQPSGSTLVVGIGRGNVSAFAPPTDSKGNTVQPLGTVHTYTKWQTSGTALYAFVSAAGGAGHTIATTTPAGDEVTLVAVEVIEGSRIQDFQWNEVVQPQSPVPVTSRSVTTTGPATLIALWWGDGYPDTTSQTATPDNGFVVVDTNVEQLHAFVQCAVAVRNVAAAGTYSVTWTATPVQGAQLWLVAVQ